MTASTTAELVDQMTPDQMRSALHRVLDLCNAADPGTDTGSPRVPGDNTLIVRTASGGVQDTPETERVFIRSDMPEDPADPEWNAHVFWPVGGRVEDNADPRRRWAFGELLWLDDPECDRGDVDLAVYLPMNTVWQAVFPLCATCNGSGQTVDRGSLGVSECHDCGGNQR